MINNKGFGFLNIIAFLTALFLLGLYVSVGEPVILGLLSASTAAGEGTDAYLITLGAPILILLAGLYFLTKDPNTLSFGG